MKNSVLIMLCILYLFIPPGFAAGPEDVYYARLSKADHFNSNKKKLTSVAAIIKQDRANFHEFGKQDKEDTNDVYFSTFPDREKLEGMLKEGNKISEKARKVIINGRPLIKVEIYKNRIYVKLLKEWD